VKGCTPNKAKAVTQLGLRGPETATEHHSTVHKSQI
jgi:hypothetical protein